MAPGKGTAGRGALTAGAASCLLPSRTMRCDAMRVIPSTGFPPRDVIPSTGIVSQFWLSCFALFLFHVFFFFLRCCRWYIFDVGMGVGCVLHNDRCTWMTAKGKYVFHRWRSLAPVAAVAAAAAAAAGLRPPPNSSGRMRKTRKRRRRPQPVTAAIPEILGLRGGVYGV